MNRLANSFATSIAAVAASASLLAGCGGGGGSSSPAVPAQQPTAAPTTAPQQQYPTSTIVLTFPHGPAPSATRRTPQYVSPNSTQAQFLINTINTVAPTGALAAIANQGRALTYGGGGNCSVTNNTATCTFTVITPPGSLNYTLKTFDSSNHVLSTVTNTVTITTGIANTINATLQGVVSTVSVSGATLNANDATYKTSGEALTVTASDASGATIVDGTTPANYANPILLTDNDPTGQTKLSLNGAAGASSVTVTKPSDVVTLTYPGQAENPFTITASDPGATSYPAITGGGTISTAVNDITLTSNENPTTPFGIYLDDANHGGLSSDTNWGQQTLFFYGTGGTLTVTAAESGFTNAPFSQGFTLVLNSCTNIATASANSTAPITSYTVTASGAGICSARFEESGTGYPLTGHTANTAGNPTHDGTFWISVTVSNVGVNGRSRH